ncbi:MAG TPA: MFS transporter [Fimbriiglobus sp.]|nr:MFS transporter [Fimbriiglobus sp.]
MSSPEPGSPSPWRWWVAALLLGATTINYLDRVALNQTAAAIKTTFALSNTDYGWLESGFVLAFGIGAVVTGILVDWIGVRWMYPLSVLGWSAAGFLTGFSQTYTFLLSCRVMLGLFEAGNWPCGIRTVRQVMPPQERSFGVAIFQSGTGLGAMLTPGIVALCLAWTIPGDPFAWQLPFRVIGLIGIVWAVLWVFTVPGRVLDPEHAVRSASDRTAGGGSFWEVFLNRKFYILIVLVTGVNTTWHTFRVWLPLYLETQLGYSKSDMQWLTFTYYLVADVGSWTVGLTVLGLTRARVDLFRSRLTTFGVGVGLVLTSALMPFLGRDAVLAVIFVTGFGALGLFATYFALSQEVSGRHQGKVTGTLGLLNSIYLGIVYVVQGAVTDSLRDRYEWVLAVAGIPALVAFLTVLIFWPRDRDQSHSS